MDQKHVIVIVVDLDHRLRADTAPGSVPRMNPLDIPTVHSLLVARSLEDISFTSLFYSCGVRLHPRCLTSYGRGRPQSLPWKAYRLPKVLNAGFSSLPRKGKEKEKGGEMITSSWSMTLTLALRDETAMVEPEKLA